MPKKTWSTEERLVRQVQDHGSAAVHILKRNLDYDNRTIAELKGFIEARGLEVEQPRTAKGALTRVKKWHYINTLEMADGTATAPFRFLDLPPELRNNIYSELLVYNPQYAEPACFPQILAVSKATNKEATGLLYDDVTIKAEAKKPKVNPGFYQRIFA